MASPPIIAAPFPGNLPDPGIEPMSPALAGSLFSTEPLVKSSIIAEFLNSVFTYLFI